MRRLLICLVVLPCVIRAAESVPAAELTLTFVGTGGPEITDDRDGIATLVTAGSEHVLFDAGRNLMQNLYEAGVDPRGVTTIFLSHLHNDHIEGLPNLWMTGWFLLGRTAPLRIWGPPGTRAMVAGMEAMYAFDVAHRANAFNDPQHLKIAVTEYGPDGLTWIHDGLSVSAFPVEHGDGNPAYGFRVEAGGYAVLITGDTRLCPSLLAAGQGADVVVTNILAMPAELARAPEMQGVVAKLMPVASAVELMQALQPRLAVYSHFVTKALPAGDRDTIITRMTRELGYAGPLFLARDGWSVRLDDLRPLAPPRPTDRPELDRKQSYAPVEENP